MFSTKGKQVFLKGLTNHFEEFQESLAKNMEDVVEAIKVYSQNYVPYDTGATHDSVYTEVKVEGNIIEGVVGYDAEKAIELRYARTGEVPDDNYVVENHEDINATFSTANNPNASPQWLLKGFKEFEPEIIKELTK